MAVENMYEEIMQENKKLSLESANYQGWGLWNF